MPTARTGSISTTTIRKAIQNEQVALTDEVVFTNPEFKQLITSMCGAMIVQTSHMVLIHIIWDEANPKQAYTDNQEIVINAGHPKVQEQPTRYARYCFLLGMAFHEFGHCLYTNFSMRIEYLSQLEQGYIPMMPSITSKNDLGFEMIRQFMASGPKHRFVIMLLLRSLDNIFEDVFVDASTSRDFPGTQNICLENMNYIMYADDLSTYLEDMKRENGGRYSMWALFTTALIAFLKLGIVNYGHLVGVDADIKEIKERIDTLNSGILQEIMDPQHIRRKMCQNDVFATNYDLVLRDLAAGTLPLDEPLQDKQENQPTKWRQLTTQEKEELEKAVNGIIIFDGETTHDSPRPIVKFILQKVCVSDDKGQGMDASFQKLLIDTAQKGAEQRIEREHLKVLREKAQHSLNSFDQENGITMQVRRAAFPKNGFREEYDRVWPSLKPISANIQRRLLQYMEDNREEETTKCVISGKHLDASNLYRKDEKYFKKRIVPTGSPELAVIILKDRSTSMSWAARSCGVLNLFSNKIQAVNCASLVLYDFCINLGIPVSVVGHYAAGSKVVLNVEASFERQDQNDRYRIVNTQYSGGNRDGTVLQYGISELKKRSEEHKLLFILSDGAPTAYLSENDGVQHIKQVLKEAKRHNIRVFSAALDEDVEKIKQIYSTDTGARCYEITDLTKLPIEIIRIIKRYILL